MVYVVSAEYAKGYLVDTVFNDGTRALIDLEPTIRNDARPIVRELLNVDLFARVSVDMDTLVWPNGVDLAPEYLYELSTARRIA
jgi:hypothetical protein